MSEAVQIIPRNEYKPELELKVEYYLSIIPKSEKNTKKFYRTKEIETRDEHERFLWEKEEIRRVREGHFGLSGKAYFFLNYVKMSDLESGLIRPEFRMSQIRWFDELTNCEKEKSGWGMICVKRRRGGFSWMEAADMLHDAITQPMRHFGMTSKTEQDAIELFKKVAFIYDNLPVWLRPTMASKTSKSILFGIKTKDAKGNNILKGHRSEIVLRAPTDTSWEGYALKKLIIDEAGKLAGGNLRQIFSYAEATMLQGTKRVGIPVIFGTSGDVGKEGKELMEMWHNSDVYKLKKFFYGGWMGLDELVDEYGNDNEEEAIRWITYERYRKESLSSKEYIDFIQQFPLTVQEAFTANTDTGLGNRVKLEKQRNSLLENPVQKKKGYFMLDKDGKPVFVASPRGACIIYEEPEPQYRDLYLAGQDPTDHTTSAKDVSSLSMFIMKKQHGSTPPKIVFEYTDRPNIPRDYYEQALCALMYYNDCKVMIERNKIGVITYFEERGAKHLIATSPQGLNRLIASQTYNLGYYKTKATTQYGEELIADYVENHYELIPSIELIEELQNYGLKNTDRVDALMAALIYLKDDKSIARDKKTVGGAPRFSYKFVNGILQKVYV